MSILLVAHIVTALGSLVAGSLTYFEPAARKFHITYILTGAMLGTGTILTIQHPTHLLESCVLGLGLLGVIFCQLALAKKKHTETEA
jgi:hypothetical protein